MGSVKRALHLLAKEKEKLPAQRLYEKNSFREVGRDTYQQLEVILYEKQLVEIIDNREMN